MLTLALALLCGALLAGLGWGLAPRDARPRASRVLRAGLWATLPGAALGLLLVEDLWLDTHPASLTTSVVGATLAVLGAAFVSPRET